MSCSAVYTGSLFMFFSLLVIFVAYCVFDSILVVLVTLHCLLIFEWI